MVEGCTHMSLRQPANDSNTWYMSKMDLWSGLSIRLKPDVMTSFPFHDKCTWIPKSGANLAGEVILFGRGQKNHLEQWSIKKQNYDLGGHFLRSFWYRIHLPPNRFSSKIIKTFMILFPSIIFSSKLIGPGDFSMRLWYIFEWLQNHHFLMVLQTVFLWISFDQNWFY